MNVRLRGEKRMRDILVKVKNFYVSAAGSLWEMDLREAGRVGGRTAIGEHILCY